MKAPGGNIFLQPHLPSLSWQDAGEKKNKNGNGKKKRGGKKE